MSRKVSANMEYIQNLFLAVSDYIQTNYDLESLISFLDKEPPEFRSVAYESASMEIGLKDLKDGKGLNNWIKFYRISRKVHSFHLEIGLGWAFAKAEISPAIYINELSPGMQLMVYDGIGYYYGLFKRRKTVMNQLVPKGIYGQNLHGFDQGLGRRLWYTCRGNVEEIQGLIRSFAPERQPDLWRGLGIACAYVGGTEVSDLESLLIYSGLQKKQLCAGIAMAALSRHSSNSITRDIDLTCQLICKMSLEDVVSVISKIIEPFDNSFGSLDKNWITQLEAELYERNKHIKENTLIVINN